MTSELRPKTCPRCGREAWFRYANATEAAKRSPICWGEFEEYCPGYQEYARDPITSAPKISGEK